MAGSIQADTQCNAKRTTNVHHTSADKNEVSKY